MNSPLKLKTSPLKSIFQFIPKYFKDPLSGLTHFIGFVLAIVALIVLVTLGIKIESVWHIVSYSIFGAGLILLYLASTLYHWIPVKGKAERVLRKIDHIMIFVLIAASYTPVCLIPLRGAWGWSMFGVVWGITAVGILIKIFYIHAPDWLAAAIYVGMGWLALIAIYPMVTTLQPQAIFWLFAGGVFYTVGAVVFALDWPKLWPKVFGAHELFHIFVLLGSASHFWLMYRFISEFV